MLETDKFSAEYLPNFTKQVNNWLGDMIESGHIRALSNGSLKRGKAAGSSAQPEAGSYELGERFLMLLLKHPEIHAVESLDRDLSELVTRTGRRHYQIKANHKAVAYARSLVSKNEALCQLFSTKLAGNIQDAILWLDEHERQHADFAAEPWRVRLITIPTFHTHAFLIQRARNGDPDATSGSYVYVISAPEWLHELPRGTLLSSREFLMGFAGAKPIIGIPAGTSVVNTSPIKEQTIMGKKKGAKAEQPVSNQSGLGPPILASLIYPYIKSSDGLAGEEGHRATLGGPPEGVDPVFVVFTYPVTPQSMKKDITGT